MALALCLILTTDTATAVRDRLILDDPVGMIFLDDNVFSIIVLAPFDGYGAWPPPCSALRRIGTPHI